MMGRQHLAIRTWHLANDGFLLESPTLAPGQMPNAKCQEPRAKSQELEPKAHSPKPRAISHKLPATNHRPVGYPPPSIPYSRSPHLHLQCTKQIPQPNRVLNGDDEN